MDYADLTNLSVFVFIGLTMRLRRFFTEGFLQWNHQVLLAPTSGYRLASWRLPHSMDIHIGLLGIGLDIFSVQLNLFKWGLKDRPNLC